MIADPFLGFSDPVSSWSHLLAVPASAIGAGFLYARGRGNTARVTALMIYSVALVFLFSMSGVFHLLDHDGAARGVLQRLDHAGIWVLIAGTFTPIHVILFRKHWRWAILLAVWIMAITALVLEVVFFNSFPEPLAFGLFLALGWVGAISGLLFRKKFRDPSIYLFAAGGLFYSIGAIFDFARWPVLVTGVFGPHETFHIFVVLGAAAHWAFIYYWCNHPVRNSIVFDVVIHPDQRVTARAINENLEFGAPSVEEMKKLVREKVASKYHSTIKPTISLRYRHEETLSH